MAALSVIVEERANVTYVFFSSHLHVKSAGMIWRLEAEQLETPTTGA